MSMQFSIVRSKDHPFDETAATQTFGFIAQKRRGKSYGAGVLFEKLHELGCQQIVFDNVGNWKALRLAADGKSPGLPITVFGGPSGDVPLLPENGGMVARFIMEKRISAILDISRFDDDQMERFVADACQAIFSAAQDREGDGVCMVYFEEAQRVAPEGSKKSRMAKKVELIVRVGGNYGLGSVIITQRPQDVMKGVLNQVECLFVGQLNGKHERNAIQDWIVTQGVDDLRERMKEVPYLERGEFFLWSPTWLETFAKVKIRKKHTFDGSATPKLGSKTKPIQLSRMEVDGVKEALSKMVDKYNDTDPKTLRARIAKLERENQELRVKPPVEVVAKIDVEPIEKLIEAVNHAEELTHRAWAAIATSVRAKQNSKGGAPPKSLKPVTPKALEVTTIKPSGSIGLIDGEKIPKTAMAILGVLESTKKPMSVNQIAKMSGYSNRSSGLHAAMSFLRSRGLIEGNGDSIQITEAGTAVAPTTTRIPTGGQELVDYWVRKLDSASSKVLSNLSADWSTLEEISDATGYSLKSSGLHAAMSNLKKLKLIEASSARFRLCEEMRS